MKKEVSVPNFIQMEHDTLKLWEDKKFFQKLVKQNEKGERFRFLDGPATANNRLGVHHFWGRTLKDIAIRYHSLKGKSCHFQNGFDAQGLWVEVNVEKELGLNGKPEIVGYGLDRFTNKCMERVNYFADEITKQSVRMGQWMDWDNSYYTNSDHNITSIWHFLKKCDEKGWIVKKNRPMAWCPRCGTSLSDHELASSYKEVTHTALFIKLPVKNTDFKIVAWTTTPWTLSANVALAVNANNDYVKVQMKDTGERLVLGLEAVKNLKGEYKIIEQFKGEKLLELEYETCFPELDTQQFAHKIIPWAEVDSKEGSGVVHIAPGCGAEDFELGKQFDLPEICPINEQGLLLDNYGFLAGKKTVDVVEDVINRLKQDDKLVYSHLYKHSYAHCWRCKTDIVYKLISAWFIRMDELKPALLDAVEEVEFQPAYAKKRMVDWLTNMGDWNISRSRFYGLPLPFYVCEKCSKIHVIGSLEELRKLAINPQAIDSMPNIHRPWIDEVKIKCDKCGEVLSRIPEVGDVWLDAGITPFSTKKYFTDIKFFEENFPSDYVCEMIEQIKGWFYSLLVMSVVLTGKAPYKKLSTYQYVNDENGNEFHKSGGNSLDADVVADKMGADTIRYLYGGAPIANDMRFGYSLTDEARRKMLGFWNIYTFFNTYAYIDNPNIKDYKINAKNLSVSDKWLVESVNKFVKDSDENYAENKNYNVVKDFEVLIDDISNFYIRSNRKRFWKSENADDQMTAYWFLYHSIKAICGVMAPIIPFMTDYIWRNMVCEIEPKEAPCVMLSKFPTSLLNENFEGVIEDVARAREIITLAQRLRNESQIKIKQPLKNLYLIIDKDTEKAVKKLENIIKEELNIKNIVFEKDNQRFNIEFLGVNFKTAGAVLKGDVQKLKTHLASLSAGEMKRAVVQYKAGKVSTGEFTNLDSNIFTLNFAPKSDFIIAIENGNTAVLDITIDENLMLEGMFREIVRQAQILRKEADFNIEQRISLTIESDSDTVQQVLAKFEDKIKQDVLVRVFGEKIKKPDIEKTVEINGESMSFSLKSL